MVAIMKPIAQVLNSTRLFVAMLVWLLAYVAAHLWPAAWWLDVRTVSAGPAQAGEVVPMVVDREINRPFVGTWTVNVRKWEGDGWVVSCYATGTSHYQSGNELPQKLTLGWWTGGACKTLDAGRYVVGTVWQIEPAVSLFPAKQTAMESNIFEVTP